MDNSGQGMDSWPASDSAHGGFALLAFSVLEHVSNSSFPHLFAG